MLSSQSFAHLQNITNSRAAQFRVIPYLNTQSPNSRRPPFDNYGESHLNSLNSSRAFSPDPLVGIPVIQMAVTMFMNIQTLIFCRNELRD